MKKYLPSVILLIAVAFFFAACQAAQEAAPAATKGPALTLVETPRVSAPSAPIVLTDDYANLPKQL